MTNKQLIKIRIKFNLHDPRWLNAKIFVDQIVGVVSNGDEDENVILITSNGSYYTDCRENGLLYKIQYPEYYNE